MAFFSALLVFHHAFARWYQHITSFFYHLHNQKVKVSPEN